MFVCFLDASKAFDRVDYSVLFCKFSYLSISSVKAPKSPNSRI